MHSLPLLINCFLLSGIHTVIIFWRGFCLSLALSAFFFFFTILTRASCKFYVRVYWLHIKLMLQSCYKKKRVVIQDTLCGNLPTKNVYRLYCSKPKRWLRLAMNSVLYAFKQGVLNCSSIPLHHVYLADALIQNALQFGETLKLRDSGEANYILVHVLFKQWMLQSCY